MTRDFLEKRLQSLDTANTNDLFHEECQGLSLTSSGKALSAGDDKRRSKKHVGQQSSAHYAAPHIKQGKGGSKQKCSCCGQEHYNGRCKEFITATPAQRRELVLKARLCFNCLIPNHSAEACQSLNRCYVCKEKHHSKLHQDRTLLGQTESATGNINTFSAHAAIDQVKTMTARSEEHTSELQSHA